MFHLNNNEQKGLFGIPDAKKITIFAIKSFTQRKRDGKIRRFDK